MEKFVTLSKVFSDYNRACIFALILRDKQVCVCEICDTLNLSQPLVSRHLKQMKDANILQASQNKKWVVYSLVQEKDSILKCLIKEIKKNTFTLPKLVVCSKV
jgi:ArsR family transcriptional regulator